MELACGVHVAPPSRLTSTCPEYGPFDSPYTSCEFKGALAIGKTREPVKLDFPQDNAGIKAASPSKPSPRALREPNRFLRVGGKTRASIEPTLDVYYSTRGHLADPASSGASQGLSPFRRPPPLTVGTSSAAGA